MITTVQDLIDTLGDYDGDQPVCVAVSTAGKTKEFPIETCIEGEDGMAVFCFGEKGVAAK